MSNKPISLSDLDALRQLKIIRADNETYQQLLRSYYHILIENGDLKNVLRGYESQNEELTEINEELQDQIDSMQEDYDEMEKEHAIIKKAIKTFIQDLKKLKDDEEEGLLHDVGL